jgi:two-component system CheB/CheR fusion protein
MKLQTVAELHNKLSDFEQANNDMKNLLSTENRNTVSRQRVKHTQVWSRNKNQNQEMQSGLDLVNDLNYPDMGRMHKT